MKSYLTDTVYDAAKKRIRWLFSEFDNVVVCFSGGKDSTVTLNLTLEVAAELNRLPVTVMFLDQEAEWDSVIEYIRHVMEDPRVTPAWLQVPFRIFNGTSNDTPWLQCWEPGAKWLRPQEPIAITENVYGTDRFYELFGAWMKHHFTGPVVALSGVRAEESPARLQGLTAYETYKGETWGKVRNAKLGHYDMYPLYDWSYTDIWKAIHDNNWPYCVLYDEMYRHGMPVNSMRVSNLNHETAVPVLKHVQEIESDLWNRLTERLAGINSTKHLQGEFTRAPDVLPHMFKDWREYRDHLIENLITDPAHRASFKKTFASFDRRYDASVQDKLVKAQIGAVLVNDFEGSKMSTFAAQHGSYSINAGAKGGKAAAIRKKRAET